VLGAFVVAMLATAVQGTPRFRNVLLPRFTNEVLPSAPAAQPTGAAELPQVTSNPVAEWISFILVVALILGALILLIRLVMILARRLRESRPLALRAGTAVASEPGTDAGIDVPVVRTGIG